MTKKQFMYLIPFAGMVLLFGQCQSDTAIHQHITQKNMQPDSLSQNISLTLTITKVKRPWYAFRFLVINGFKKSIPEYDTIKGLVYKAYALTEKDNFFGGIYLWETEKDARNWFSPAWFTRVEKTYKTQGIVEYYEIIQVENLASITQNIRDYTSVLSVSVEDFTIDRKANGLLKIFSLKDSADKTGFVTLWQTHSDAENYFKNKPVSNEYFDTPVLINKIGQK